VLARARLELGDGHASPRRDEVLAIGVVASAPQAHAATLRVGPGETYSSLAEVAELVQPGDVVELMGDNTYEGGVSFWNPGTSDQKITIRGVRANGKRPVLTGGNNTIEAGGNHYVFEGLELTGGDSRCFYHHAHDIVLRDSVVHDCPKQGVLGADTDSGSLLMEYVEVYRNGEGTQNHQIYMATDESAHPGSVVRMQHCYVHDGNGGNNVKSRAERNEIYYNWIEGAMYHEVELIGPDGQDPALAREDSDVVGNVLVKRADTFVVRFGGDGTGDTNGRYRFVNNTVVVQPGGSAVFRLFDGIESLSAHNNVFYAAGGGTVDMVREVEAAWTHGAPLVSGSSNWVSAGASNVPQSWSDTREGSDPGFVDVAADDLRLLEESALVDAGADTTPDPSGAPFTSALAAPEWSPPLHDPVALGGALPRPLSGPIDIGAYEHGTPEPGGAGGEGPAGGGDPGPNEGEGDGDEPGGGAADGDGGCQLGAGGAGRAALPGSLLAGLLFVLGRRRRQSRGGTDTKRLPRS
jgi:hypothetical protein